MCMNRSNVWGAAFLTVAMLSAASVAVAAEKKGSMGAGSSSSSKSDSYAPAKKVTGLGGGDPKNFAKAMRTIGTMNPRAISTASKVGNNSALRTLTSNPNAMKTIAAMSKVKGTSELTNR